MFSSSRYKHVLLSTDGAVRGNHDRFDRDGRIPGRDSGKRPRHRGLAVPEEHYGPPRYLPGGGDLPSPAELLLVLQVSLAHRCAPIMVPGYFRIFFFECEPGTTFDDHLDQCVFPHLTEPCSDEPFEPPALRLLCKKYFQCRRTEQNTWTYTEENCKGLGDDYYYSFQDGCVFLDDGKNLVLC
ncbi:hypothetical protein E2C01_048570 [Portunus trituberculatus]|uniref:Chitin-binding type-2 domain-containing protein n=1 Tax=Portunus trituberculatus TaxID=210409 RepID=A0A5B7GBB2_PORTR|nr:hypothetical protein [Portunus trituberculatus]